MVKKVFGNTAKWASGINEQLKEINQEDINTQYISLDQIVLDPENSRTMTLTLKDIVKAPKLPKGNFDEITQDSFEKVVKEFFSGTENVEQKINEYLSLARFASGIKSPENLINPITVFMRGMKCHVISGHRRTLAHHIMGAKNISAKIVKEPANELETSLLQWGENQYREDLSLNDQLRAQGRIIKAWEEINKKKISMQNLMSLLSAKKTKAVWILKVYRNTDDRIRQLIEDGTIDSLELAYKISSINNEQDKIIAINDIKSGKIKNAKDFPSRSKVRPPNPVKPSLNDQEFGRRTLLNSKDLSLTIKSEDALNLINKILSAVANHDFKKNLKSDSQKEILEGIEKKMSEITKEKEKVDA